MRLFLALWPDDALRERIQEVTRAAVAGASGRPVPAESLHLTLAFLGEVAEEQCARVEAAVGVAAVGHGPFELALTRIGAFERARVLWIGGPATAPLRALLRDLRDRLAGEGIMLDRRRFQPHVSVARGLRPAADGAAEDDLGLGDLEEPLRWPVDRLVLVRSYTEQAGARYEVLGEWALAG